MAIKYKSYEESGSNISISMKFMIQELLHELALEYDTDRSKLIVALVKYLKDNKKDTKFSNTIIEILKDG